MLFIVEDIGIASYADNNALYISANNINEVTHFLKKATDALFRWFSDNLTKSDKCHLLDSTKNTINIQIMNVYITNSTCEKLLGVKFDLKRTFGDHNSELCINANTKNQALARVTPYINLSKKTYTYERVLQFTI